MENYWTGLAVFVFHIHYEVGDGTLIKFWQDRWCGQTSLAVCYPELFRLSCNKDTSVADFMHFTNVVLHWDLHFVGAIQVWEFRVLDDFHFFFDK